MQPRSGRLRGASGEPFLGGHWPACERPRAHAVLHGARCSTLEGIPMAARVGRIRWVSVANQGDVYT